ncbi:hypothetical protein CC2G_003453 [Coprinopsis cinerea AmutBmut pab1-1]|nr:hypothetical protein CC2G_003453 [Coprinopsis cinerea AmutBmut pab1-1]
MVDGLDFLVVLVHSFTVFDALDDCLFYDTDPSLPHTPDFMFLIPLSRPRRARHPTPPFDGPFGCDFSAPPRCEVSLDPLDARFDSSPSRIQVADCLRVACAFVLRTCASPMTTIESHTFTPSSSRCCHTPSTSRCCLIP